MCGFLFFVFNKKKKKNQMKRISHLFFPLKEDVLAPPPESDDVINDFDIEEEVIEVENRCVIGNASGSPVDLP